jgi:large subunit ribosomal protein L5
MSEVAPEAKVDTPVEIKADVPLVQEPIATGEVNAETSAKADASVQPAEAVPVQAGDKASAPAKTGPGSMRQIKIAKITLNIGAGKSDDMLKKGLALLKKLSPQTPVKTLAKKRIPAWGLRPGLAIGCKVTVRKNTEELLKRLLVAKENQLKARNFDQQGNLSFGIPEYIDIEGLEYDPDLKILGLEVAVTLERPGFRINKRKMSPKPVGRNHRITKESAIEFIQNFGVEVIQ